MIGAVGKCWLILVSLVFIAGQLYLIISNSASYMYYVK